MEATDIVKMRISQRRSFGEGIRNSPNFLSKSDAIEFLGIKELTFDHWVREGLIKPYQIMITRDQISYASFQNTPTYRVFKKSELIELLEKKKNSKHYKSRVKRCSS